MYSIYNNNNNIISVIFYYFTIWNILKYLTKVLFKTIVNVSAYVFGLRRALIFAILKKFFYISNAFSEKYKTLTSK